MPAILNAIANRRSTRKFQSRPVEPELIDAMIEAARLAPGACNLSHFRVIVVDQPGDLEVVRKAGYSMGAVSEAPVSLLLMVDHSIDEPFKQMMAEMMKSPTPAYDLASLRSGTGLPFELKVGREWAFINAGIAGEHMMLQAVEMGLAGCWVHHFEHSEVREHFKLPDHIELVSLMAIGYPDENPPQSAGRTDIRYQVQ